MVNWVLFLIVCNSTCLKWKPEFYIMLIIISPLHHSVIFTNITDLTIVSMIFFWKIYLSKYIHVITISPTIICREGVNIYRRSQCIIIYFRYFELEKDEFRSSPRKRRLSQDSTRYCFIDIFSSICKSDIWKK